MTDNQGERCGWFEIVTDESVSGIGPKAPLEGVRPNIEGVIDALKEIFSESGMDLEGWADLVGHDAIEMSITLENGVIIVTFSGEKPRIHVMNGFIKSAINRITADRDKIVVDLAGLPDITFKVGS